MGPRYSYFLIFFKSQVPVFPERQFLWGLHLWTKSRKSQGSAFETLAVQFDMRLLGRRQLRDLKDAC